VVEILERVYHALDVLPRRRRSKQDFYTYLNVSKHTFNEYLKAVGMPWLKGQGPPARDHLILVFDAATHLLVWVSPSICTIAGRTFDQLVGNLASDVLRQGRRVPQDEANFVTILQQVTEGQISIGEMSTHILLDDGTEIPLDLRISFGAGHAVIFVDATISMGASKAETFNVIPGVIPREYALTIDRRVDVRELLERYLPPYQFPSKSAAD